MRKRYAVTNISLIENANGDMFVSMHIYKLGELNDNGNAVYKDICNPVIKEARGKIRVIAFAEYKKAKDESRDSRNQDKSEDNFVPDWIEAHDDELPFPGKDEEERAIGYIPVKQEKHEEKHDKPIKVARKGR